MPAGTASTDEIFSAAKPTDETVQFLDQIFGSGWHIALFNTPPAGGASGVFMELFSAFNAVILASVALLIFYVVSAGVIGTAHEGEPLGKRYSTLWTPVRTAFSVSLLMPLPWAKYSMLQALILYFTYFGISGADYLQTKVVQYMQEHGGRIEMPAASESESITEAGKNAIFALMAQSYYTDYLEHGMSEPRFSCDVGDQEIKCTFGVPDGASFTKADLGGVIVPCKGGKEICEKRAEAFQNLVAELAKAAEALVSRFDGGEDLEINPDEIVQKYEHFHRVVDAHIEEVVADINSKNSEGMNKFVRVAEDKGWGFLGAWYWTLAGFSENAREQVLDSRITVLPINAAAIATREGGTFQTFVTRYNNLIDRVDVEEMQDAAAGFDESMGAFAGKIFGDWNPGIVIVNSLASGDPIANMQRVGHWMTGAGMAGVALVNRLSSLTGSGKTIGADNGGKSGFSFVGKMVDKLSGGMLESALSLAPYILLALIFCGVTLAYYLPSVPYVLWTMGIISWVILVIETVVAAPIWAAGHAVPEGEGMAGQHGRQGYLLFLGVLMRPALMVIGFFAAYVVIAVVGHFIGATFAVFMAGLMQDSGIFEGMAIGAIGGGLAGAAGGGLVGAGLGAAGTAVGMSLLAVLATVFLGGGTLIIAVHKVFNLITWLPDNIMRWIGSGMPSLGEQGDEGRIKQIFVGAMGKVESVATPAARGAHQSMKKMAGDKDADHALAQKGEQQGMRNQRNGQGSELEGKAKDY